MPLQSDHGRGLQGSLGPAKKKLQDQLSVCLKQECGGPVKAECRSRSAWSRRNSVRRRMRSSPFRAAQQSDPNAKLPIERRHAQHRGPDGKTRRATALLPDPPVRRQPLRCEEEEPRRPGSRRPSILIRDSAQSRSGGPPRRVHREGQGGAQDRRARRGRDCTSRRARRALASSSTRSRTRRRRSRSAFRRRTPA